MKTTISAYIITKDEEQNIARAIGSVRWMDEVVVLDSGSADNTCAIAESMGAKVFHSPFEGYAGQKNKAMAECSSDWLFNLDADEEMTPELRRSVEAVLADEHGADVYEISRKVRYLGRWMLHSGWYPEYRSRLSKRSAASWRGGEVHESLRGSGRPVRLDGELLHYPYASLGEHIATIGRYTEIWSKREAERGRRSTLSDLLFRPPFKFVKMYVLKAGILDGLQGFVAAVMGTFYVFMKYARLYEIQRGFSGAAETGRDDNG